MQTENTVEATLNAWQAQLDDIRRRRVERGGGHAGRGVAAAREEPAEIDELDAEF